MCISIHVYVWVRWCCVHARDARAHVVQSDNGLADIDAVRRLHVFVVNSFVRACMRSRVGALPPWRAYRVSRYSIYTSLVLASAWRGRIRRSSSSYNNDYRGSYFVAYRYLVKTYL